MSLTRREFLGASGAALAGLPKLTSSVAPSLNGMRRTHQRTATVLLFQGDSITDVDRDRKNDGANDQLGLGRGYPLLVAAALRDHQAPRNLQIFNRGVSGNRVPDLDARWSADTLALKPDVLSILIGVNDLWHTLMGRYDGTPEKYAHEYRALLDRTRTALPDLRLVILEPFVLRTGAVDARWFPVFDQFRAAAKRVAHDAHATFIPLHDMFQSLARNTGPAYWLADGVHPTLAGHAAIARRWLEAVKL